MTRQVNAAAQAVRARRIGTIERKLLWVAAKNRSTGAIEAIGLWDGADDEIITVPDMFTGLAQSRMFYGAGSLLDVGEVSYAAGLNIRAMTVTLSPLSVAVKDAFRAYDARGALAQVWRRTLDPVTRRPVGVEGWFKGFINRAPFERAAVGGESSLSVEIVSTARTLTITSGLMKSDQAQRARSPGDAFRQHKAAISTVVTPWGSKDSKGDGKGGET